MTNKPRMKHPVLKTALLIVLLVILTPYMLSALYLHIRPPSTLMLKGWLTGEKVEREWVPLEEMSPHLKRAVVLAEDEKFCEHWGFDFKQLGKSIDNLIEQRKKRVKGASTITQQLAKNLFLWHGRSWMRKTLEAPLTIWLEMTWSKRQIFETYLNIVEMGDGVYGVESGSQYHFRTTAKNLTMLQASLLATSLPNPERRNASAAGPAQTLHARGIVLRLLSSPPDLSCIN